jgi:hypothetical protein
MAERLSKDLGIPVDAEEAYAKRHGGFGLTCEELRDKWFRYLNEFRADDKTKLVRLVLEKSDFVCGIRSGVELQAAKDERLLDLVVWVDRPGVPVDPTVEFGKTEADVIILNDGTLVDYHKRWDRLASAFNIRK